MDKLNDTTTKPILTAIGKLADNPRPHGYTDLKGRSGFRIRVGNYRVIYEIYDMVLLVDVVEVGNRRGIYD